MKISKDISLIGFVGLLKKSNMFLSFSFMIYVEVAIIH
jgi:hypothetical protein